MGSVTGRNSYLKAPINLFRSLDALIIGMGEPPIQFTLTQQQSLFSYDGV